MTFDVEARRLSDYLEPMAQLLTRRPIWIALNGAAVGRCTLR